MQNLNSITSIRPLYVNFFSNGIKKHLKVFDTKTNVYPHQSKFIMKGYGWK